MDEKTDRREPRHDPVWDPGPSKPREEPSRKAVPRRAGRRLLGLLAVIALLVGTYQAVRWLHAPQPRHGPSLMPQPVGAASVARGDIRIIVNALGTVTPLATVTVMSQINGQLVSVGFREGQIVKKGDFLAQIDQRPYEQLLAQYQGQLAHDQGLLDQARSDLARYQSLLKQNSIARQQAEDQVYIVKQYEGSVLTDQALINAQKLNISYCHIVAPVDGRVGLRLVDPGNYVQTTNTTGIVVITKLQPISVVFSVPEDDLPPVMDQLKAGAKLPATAFDRANVRQLAVGTLSTYDNQIDTTTGTVKLRAEFDNGDEKLFPNQFVNVQLLVNTLRNVVTVPTAAIQRGAPGTYVYVIAPDNVVSVRPVTLGPTDGDMVEVGQGLAPGERVVVDGADRLRDGARVTIPAARGGSAGAGSGGAPGAPGQGRQRNQAGGRNGRNAR